MKYTALGLFALVATSSAQVTNSTSSTPPVAPANTTTTAATPTSVSACAVQSTFELCLRNEDNYIKTCQEQDFACLCRWHKEKLTCWNNCPNDEGYARQEGIVSSLCSMPGANVSIAPWTSSIAPTMTPMTTRVLATSAPAVPSTPINKPSSASMITIGQGALTLVGVITAYFLF